MSLQINQEMINNLVKDINGITEAIKAGREADTRRLDEFKEGLASMLIQHEDLQAKNSSLTEKIEGLEEKIDTLEKGYEKHVVSLPGLEEDLKKDPYKFKFARLFYAQHTKDWTYAGYEKEVIEETKKLDKTEQKAPMLESVDAQGGHAIPEQLSSVIIEELVSGLVGETIGMTIIDNLVGSPFRIPDLNGTAEGFWVGQDAAITEGSAGTGLVELNPHRIGSAQRFDLLFLQLASNSVEAAVRRTMERKMRKTAENAMFVGSGVGVVPEGLLNNTNIGNVDIGTNGGPITFKKMRELRSAVRNADGEGNNNYYVFNPIIEDILFDKRVPQFSGQTDGEFIVPPVGDMELAIRSIIGRPYAWTTHIPTNLTKGTGTNLTPIFYGNWEDFWVGFWRSFRIAVSDQAEDVFLKDQTIVKMVMELDFKPVRNAAFQKITDAETTL